MGGASLVPVQMWEGRARPRCNAVVGGCVYNDMPFPDGPLKAAAVGSVWGGEVRALSDAAGRLARLCSVTPQSAHMQRSSLFSEGAHSSPCAYN